MSKHKYCGGSIRVILTLLLLICMADSWADGILPDREVEYKQTPEGALHLLMWGVPQSTNIKASRGALILVHGGGWKTGAPEQFGHLCQQLAQHGLLAISVEYRLSRNMEYSELQNQVEDVRAAVRWVRTHADELGISPNKIALGGGSAGGYLALADYAYSRFGKEDGTHDGSSVPDALVLYNPMIAIKGFTEGVRAMNDQYRIASTPLYLPPTLIMHGTADRISPYKKLREFVDLNADTGSSQLELKTFDGRGHGFFNYGRGRNPDFYETTNDVFNFLSGLDYFPPREYVSMENTRTTNLQNIDIHQTQEARPISKSILGTNILYWVDDDNTWNNPKFKAQLQALGIVALRFPGGTVAENYDWETNRLERPNKFPFETGSDNELMERLDYKKFLADVKATGIPNLFFVVNVQGAFIRGGDIDDNIQRYADKAARWVKAVRQAGYHVKYWEIGNEAYERSVFGLTAHEYAKVLRIFYRKMKREDPAIKIGAIGPNAIDGPRAISFADRLDEEDLKYYRKQLRAGENPCHGERGPRCIKMINRSGKRGISGDEKWWNVVLNEARNSFDFIVIHRYGGADARPNEFSSQSIDTLDRRLEEFKQNVEARKGSPLMLALTEWNTPNQTEKFMSDEEHSLEIAEEYGEYLSGGVDFALYWPLRMKGRRFSLLNYNHMTPTLSFLTLKFMQGFIGTDLAESTGNGRDVFYVLATSSAKNYDAVLVNKTQNKSCTRLTVNHQAVSIITEQLMVDNSENRNSKEMVDGESRGVVCIPGQTIAGVKFKAVHKAQ